MSNISIWVPCLAIWISWSLADFKACRPCCPLSVHCSLCPRGFHPRSFQQRPEWAESWVRHFVDCCPCCQAAKHLSSFWLRSDELCKIFDLRSVVCLNLTVSPYQGYLLTLEDIHEPCALECFFPLICRSWLARGRRSQLLSWGFSTGWLSGHAISISRWVGEKEDKTVCHSWGGVLRPPLGKSGHSCPRYFT